MKRPKVLLINPDPNPYVEASKVDFGAPMAILAIGTYLKHKGMDVTIIDARLYKAQSIFEKIDAGIGSARLVGLSVMTAQIKEALRLSAYIRSKYKDVKIVWGGVHPTLFPEQTLASDLVDFIVIGEGDVTAYELASRAEGSEGRADYSDIKGLGFKSGGKPVINKRRELMKMDDVPPQAFELLDVERYVNAYYPFVGLRRELLVQTSRGCPHRCAFCINYVERNYNIWRSKSPSLVLDEIRDLKDRHNLNGISFRDENFYVNPKHAKGVIDGMRGMGIRWFANIRADYFHDKHVSRDLLKDSADAGAAYLGVGAESGSERILKLICKDITVDQIIKTAEDMNAFNIVASYSFVIGIPGETREEMQKTIDLMKRLKKICPRSMFSGPQILRPYPGGSLYDLCAENGYRSPTTLEGWANQETGKFGQLSMKSYPWIKEPALVTALSTYVPAALNYDFMKNMDLKRKIYAFMARARLALNFWIFPYEWQLAMRGIKYLNIMKRAFSKLLFWKKEGADR
jgi:magnesium-protoporphyrin IX monomethyl ester (oxidative) cyclase